MPVVGHSFSLAHDNLRFVRESCQRFGTVFWATAFGQPLVIVTGPDAIGSVLANRDRAFSNAAGWEFFIGPFFERGVMLMDFEEHLHHRRIMQQAFTRDCLEGYLDTMTPVIESGLSGWPKSGEMRLLPVLKQLTLDIATRVFVGDELGPMAREVNDAFIDVVIGGQALVRADVPGGKWHRGLQSRRLLEEHFGAQVPDKRTSGGSDLFSVLSRAETEEGDRFTDDDVVNHVIFTMMAAHDTSTITLAMMAYYLGKHPEWQVRLRAECKMLRRSSLRFEDLASLPLMDLVFKETLRMNAPVGLVARGALKDTAIDGFFVPEGTRLMLGIYPTQRMEPWWQDPDTFDPERFSAERREDAWHKFAWAPFGGNVHKCIGMHFGRMEVKAILHQLLLRYRWTVPADDEPTIDWGTGPFPGDRLPVTLTRIS